ncbi:helix-turn-helix transcriptional regulator [Vibrio rotiferianus]|uniref:helix-turn-helix transcriptional regulator n=1 Tax=Vibrio rotiferianus TaxID=190895 RepID=UPI00390AFC46
MDDIIYRVAKQKEKNLFANFFTNGCRIIKYTNLSGSIFINNDRIDISHEDILFIPQYKSIKTELYKKSNCEHMEVEIFFIRSNLIKKIMSELPEFVENTENKITYQFNCKNINSYFNILKDCACKTPFCSMTSNAILSKIISLMINMSSSRAMFNTKQNRHNSHILDRIEDAVLNNPSQSWTKEKMREKLNITVSEFDHNLRKLGVKYSSFVTETIINESINMMLTSDLPISIVAQKCGYNDASYFIKVFKKVRGISPHKFKSSFNYKV